MAVGMWQKAGRSGVARQLRGVLGIVSSPLLGLLLGLLLWWVLTSPLLHPGAIVGDFSPEKSLTTVLKLLGDGTLEPHIGASLRRVVVGLAAAALIGIPVGIALGLWRPLEQGTSVLFQFVRMVSPLSWMPLAVMAFGIGDAPVYFLLTVAAVWPVLLNAAAGVHSVDRRWLLLARSLCATRWEVIGRVILPAIRPHLFVGLRLAVGVIWIVLVPAEMLGVSSGLGYFILDTRDRLAYSELMAAILTIGAIGYGLDTGLRSLNRLTHYS
ncbi:MAG: ABC transporter permease [Limnothrix sp.]|nr:ABC transporter permease [Limnothrix sp.]